MTIAIAVQANGGVIMAADTLVSTGYLKSDEDKIWTLKQVKLGQSGETQGLPFVFGITGAGDAGYVDKVMTDAMTLLQTNTVAEQHPIVNYHTRFSEYLEDFYKHHIIPFLSGPPDERPTVQFIIGTCVFNAPYMLVTDRTTVRVPRLPYAAIGIGADLAENLLKHLWRPASISEIQKLAAYVVFRVKEAIEGCGNYTTLWTLRAPTLLSETGQLAYYDNEEPIQQMQWQEIAALEHAFRTTWAPEERNLIWKLIVEYEPSKSGPN